MDPQCVMTAHMLMTLDVETCQPARARPPKRKTSDSAAHPLHADALGQYRFSCMLSENVKHGVGCQSDSNAGSAGRQGSWEEQARDRAAPHLQADGSRPGPRIQDVRLIWVHGSVP